MNREQLIKYLKDEHLDNGLELNIEIYYNKHLKVRIRQVDNQEIAVTYYNNNEWFVNMPYQVDEKELYVKIIDDVLEKFKQYTEE